MAQKIATFAFINKDSYEAARDKIKSELGNDSWDSSSTSDYWLLHILSDCSNPSHAAQICSGYGGRPY